MFERRTKAKSWDQGGLVPRAVKHLEYLMTHYGEYDMKGGDNNEWVSISSTKASHLRASTAVKRVDWMNLKVNPIHLNLPHSSLNPPQVGGVRTTPIAGGVQTREVQTTPITGGRGSSGRASNAGRGRGRAMQTNHQRFVDKWLSNSVPVEAPQSQERPPLMIPPMPPRTDAPTNPYKKTLKPPRKNWRL
ncbi:hypothetical protein GIB67_040723 [Kingdonia uniflora]|uniref:Uncharacterized protein n=1 Tax=Kingdonia uniflora TaxID=39325 RepID=A0A7J7KUC2_9MAGN|nr:hypothetical protein GIB67_040723 [Kingdonia uniflora]